MALKEGVGVQWTRLEKQAEATPWSILDAPLRNWGLILKDGKSDVLGPTYLPLCSFPGPAQWEASAAIVTTSQHRGCVSHSGGEHGVYGITFIMPTLMGGAETAPAPMSGTTEMVPTAARKAQVHPGALNAQWGEFGQASPPLPLIALGLTPFAHKALA